MKLRRTLPAAALGLLGALAAVGPICAQEPRFLVGFQAGIFEPEGFSDSYDAVYGESLQPLGLRFEWAITERFALHLQSHLMSADGEQVAIVPGTGIVPTGIETELELNPWHLTAAWRIHPEGPWSGHVGIGPTLVRAKESNEFGEVSMSGFGGHLAAGIRRAFGASGAFVVGAEGIYATAPSTFEDAGAAGFFDEDDGGGLTAQLLVGYAF
jgi:hypothetical protein